jgi:peptidoglycan/xylan/chitin deacetylase (PgdA/CDA1 family)
MFRSLRQAAFRAGLDAIYYTGMHRMLAPLAEGAGVIFTLHHVRPARPSLFDPNGILEVTPEFLDKVLHRVRRAGVDLVSLDEARKRLVEGTGRRFACFTLDDGYRDNLVHALPVFRRHGCPFTVFATTSFLDGEGELWWRALEAVIAGADEVSLTVEAETRVRACATPAEKALAFDELWAWLRQVDEAAQRQAVRKLCADAGFDMRAQCRELVMTWDELRQLAADPLATIGAHTVHHYELGKLGRDEAWAEMVQGADRLEAELGTRPRHFSYPYGAPRSAGPREFALARESGFETAVTTRPGMLYAEHRGHLMALPRVSLNGRYQLLRYLDVFLSGAPFVVYNGFRRMSVA